MKTDSFKFRTPEPLELAFVTVKFLPQPSPRAITDIEHIPHTSIVMYDDIHERHVIFYLQYEIKDFDLKRFDRNTMRRYFYNAIINQIMGENIVGNNGRRPTFAVILPPNPREARNVNQQQNPDDADSVWNSLMRMVDYHNDKENDLSSLHIGKTPEDANYNLKLNLGNYLTFNAFKHDPSNQRHREMLGSSCGGTCTIMNRPDYHFAVRTVMWWERGLNRLCGFLDKPRLENLVYGLIDQSFGELCQNTSLILSDIKFKQEGN